MATVEFDKLGIKLSSTEVADEVIKLLTRKLGWNDLKLHECRICNDSVWIKNLSPTQIKITDDPELVKLFHTAEKISKW